MWRGTLAGLIFCGVAGASMTKSWGVAAYGLGADGGGAGVYEMLGPEWPMGVGAGMVIGAILGAFIVFAAGAAWAERGSAYGILAVGAVCGALSAASWGSDLAQRRVVTVRAVHPSASPAPPEWKPFFSVSASGVNLSGMVERKTNVPLLVFLILGGAVVGALAGRGLVGNWPEGEQFASPSDRSFVVIPAVPTAARVTESG
jgi:hypothetical protein